MAAGVGGFEARGEAARFDFERELFFHDLRKPPGSIDQEKASLCVCEGEERRIDFEEKIVGEIGELVDGVGVKDEAGSIFKTPEGAFFQVFTPMAEDDGWKHVS